MENSVALHLTVAIPALFLGLFILVSPKGTSGHRFCGRVWVALMAVAAISSYWISHFPGGGFSWIHILSTITMCFLVLGVWAIRTGRRRLHAGCMIGNFIGIVGAGAGALAPDRIVGKFLFG